MPRKSRATQQLYLVAAKVPSDLYEAARAFADSNTGGNMSEAVNVLLRETLSSRSGLQGLADSLTANDGYNAGLRQGLHEGRTAMRAALDRLWRR